LCAEMRSQGVTHEHRSLHFRVRLPSGEVVAYDPDLVARRGPLVFLVEPLEGARSEPRRLELLAAFLDQHSPEIVLVVVAPRKRLASLPPSAYDEAYASEDVGGAVRRIREQDPRGMIRPFPKPKA
jgi:hypothetical protein